MNRIIDAIASWELMKNLLITKMEINNNLNQKQNKNKENYLNNNNNNLQNLQKITRNY